jgi:hypothetical protein
MTSVDQADPRFDPDDVQLVRLACVKLANLLQGALSIGLPALITGVPEPRGFLAERFEVMEAFVTVLDCVGGRPELVPDVRALRHLSGQLRQDLRTLRVELQAIPLALADKPSDPFQPATQSLDAVCDGLAAYAARLGFHIPRLPEVKTRAIQMMQALPDLLASTGG